MTPDEVLDLLEALEAGQATPDQHAAACKLAEALTTEEMRQAEAFGPDDSDVRVLDVRVVRGSREHIDHWSKRPIPKGARQLVIREVCDGEFITTRHSELSVWMLDHGYDPSGLVLPA